MHNSVCSWKLICLLCNCQSDYRRRTGKTINVSFNKLSMSASPKQSISASTNEDYGVHRRPIVPWRQFSRAEHSLMDTRVGLIEQWHKPGAAGSDAGPGTFGSRRLRLGQGSARTGGSKRERGGGGGKNGPVPTRLCRAPANLKPPVASRQNTLQCFE